MMRVSNPRYESSAEQAISQPVHSVSSDIWAISCYFNPEHYRSKRHNLELFRDRLAQQDIPFTIVECAFQGASFDLPAHPCTLRVRANDVMWQKERLLNTAIESVPTLYNKIAWLDCDILFEDDDWHIRASEALDYYSVIQPYSKSCRLPRGATSFDAFANVSASFAWTSLTVPPARRARYKDHGRTGFAWAGRRALLQPVGLYDGCIMGGADHLMAHIFEGSPDSSCLSKFWRGRTPLQRHFEAWSDVISHLLPPGSMGAIEGNLSHLWHGESKTRFYGSRQRILKSEGFDPEVDLTRASTGAWSWASYKPKLHKQAARYFADRREDETDPSSVRGSTLIRDMRPRPETLDSPMLLHRGTAPPSDLSAESWLSSRFGLYEWCAWKGYMLPSIIPNAVRIEAQPLEDVESILARLPMELRVFAFHLNITDTSHFPLCRKRLCNRLREAGVLLLNDQIIDIGKRTIQMCCRDMGLPSAQTLELEGLASDLVMVKTNNNYAGYGEKLLSAKARLLMGIVSESPIEDRNDYRIMLRGDVPASWWADSSLIIENYKSNEGGRKYRSYFAGDNHVVMKTTASHLLMRLSTNKIELIVCTTKTRLAAQAVSELPIDLQSQITRVVEAMKIDFGAIDFVEDDAGRLFLVDVNTTTFGKALSLELIEHLRMGLMERLESKREASVAF